MPSKVKKPVSAPVVDQEPVVQKTKPKSVKKVSPPKDTESKTVPPTPPVVKSDDIVAAAKVDSDDPTENTIKEFTEFMGRLASLRTNLANLLQDFKTLQKRTERELKNAQKLGAKRKRKTGTRQPSGFVKPTLISDQLADFLGKSHGSELARTEVTREINAYIRANKLQDPSNGRKINPDPKLTKLLSIKPDEELTYFNLQRYMSPHFQKIGQAPVSTAVPLSGTN